MDFGVCATDNEESSKMLADPKAGSLGCRNWTGGLEVELGEIYQETDCLTG